MLLVREVYVCTREFPANESYGLIAQLRRSAVSVPSNIAEGQGRLSSGEFRQFLGHARGSLMELETQILIARDLNYMTHQQAATLLQHTAEIGRILNGLLSSLSGSKKLTAPERAS